MFRRSLLALVGHPYALAGVLLVLTGAAAFAARNVRFDFTPQALFASGDDAVAFSEEVKSTFAYEDSRLMVVLEALGERDVLDAASLEWQHEAAARLAKIPRVQRIDAIATLKVPQLDLSHGFDFQPQPVLRNLPMTQEDEESVRRMVDRSKMIEGGLISRDRRVGAMYVVFDPAARDVSSMRRLVESVRRTISDRPPPDDYLIRYSGLPGVRVAVVNDLMADQAFLFPLAGVLFLVLIGAVFRSVWGVVVPIAAVLVGLTWTVGIVAATGEPFNIVTNVLPILILIIGVSNSIHFVVRYLEESAAHPGDARGAAWRTLSHMLVPCLLTLVTSALGFVSLATARSRVLQTFGWHAAIGMACLYLSVLATFAVLLPRWKLRRGSGSAGGAGLLWVGRTTAALGESAARFAGPVLIGGLMLCAACAMASRHLVVNSSITETYGPNHPQTQTVRLVEESLGGVLPLEVVLTSEDAGAFLAPQLYARVAEFGDYVRRQPEVTSSQSYVDLFQEVYANFRRDQSLRGELPTLDDDGRRRIEQTAAQADRAREAVQPQLFLTDDAKQARVLVRVKDVGTRRTLDLIRRTEHELAKSFPPGCGVKPRLTGDAWLNAVAMDGFVRDLFSSLATAAFSVFVLIALLFLSPRVGLIAALPNVAPFALTLGYMGLRGYDLNAGNVAVFSISLGLTVDNSIHFLSRFREECRSGLSRSEAIRATYLNAGRAMVVSTLLQASGLVVLLWSNFVPTQRFAELMGVTMAGTMLGDLVLLPACVALFWKDGPRPEPASAVETKPLPHISRVARIGA